MKQECTIMLERDVENLLEQKLTKNGWHVNVGDIKRNVYRQNPRTEEECKKLNTLRGRKHPDFILYRDTKTTYPIAIIETKRSEYKTLQEAKEQGLLYARTLNATFLFLYNVNRFIAYYVPTEENLFVDGEELKDILPLSLLEKFNENNLNLHRSAEIRSKADLIDVFKTANNKLREAGVNAGVARFAEFSNMLFLKLISELNVERSYNLSSNYLWESYRNMDGPMLLEYLNTTVIPGLNKKFDSTESNPLFTNLLIKDPIKLKEIVDKLDTLNLSQIDSDIKGDAFEYFIQKYNQTNNDLGEYFTPRHIVKFLNDIVKPKYGDKIYDPFCGTGGMLIVAFDRLLKSLDENGQLDDETLEFLRSNTIWGAEISDTARIAKMNMILAGDGHSNIEQHDSFLNPKDNKFDIVISNIPFNMDATDEQANLYEPVIKKGNAIAILHCLRALKRKSPKARAALIVPEAVLSDKSYKDLRKILVNSGQLLGIVSLPSKVFLPYTEAKTSILIFGSKNNVKNKKIFIFKVERDGYTLTTRRKPIPGINDLDEFISLHEQMLDEQYNTELQHDKLFYIDRTCILNQPKISLQLSDYYNILADGNIFLEDVLKEVREKNKNRYPTASITNTEFWGMPLGEELWGENFFSVTSDDNVSYTEVKPGDISYNPSRANVGSFGINVSDYCVAVSSAYPVYRIKDDMTSKFLPEYIYLQIKFNSNIVNEIIDRSYGTVRQSLHKEDFLKLQIPNIPIDEQEKIVLKATELYDEFIKCKRCLKDFSVYPQNIMAI